MGLPTELTDLMLDEIVIEHAESVDKFNNFTYGSPATVSCAVFRTNKRVLDRAGRETTSTVQVILADPTIDLSINDRITLDDGTKPAIIEILSAKDDEGDYYLEIRA